MDLLVLLLIFALLGYLLGVSRIGSNADRTAEKATLYSKNWVERLGDRWSNFFNPRGFAQRFRKWVMEDAADQFPVDFKNWLDNLSASELSEFVKALTDFSHSSGYSLSALVHGDLDDDPRMRQVFVEAISVYSQAYRKAREANNKKNTPAEKESHKADEKDGKPLAEKTPSRRRATNQNETIEAASTD